MYIKIVDMSLVQMERIIFFSHICMCAVCMLGLDIYVYT